MRTIALVTVASAALAACSPQAAAPVVDTAKVGEEAKAEVDKLVAQFNAHDAEAAVAHDAADYVGMFHGTPNVVGPAADLASTKQQTADPASKITIVEHNVDVAQSGEMAVDRTTYAYDYTDPKTKKVVTEHGNWVIGLKRDGHKDWKLAWTVVSDTGPQAASPTPAPSATAAK
jgi:ketosteroid isomerase-like protein